MYKCMGDLAIGLIAGAAVVGFVALFIPSLMGAPVIAGAFAGALFSANCRD